MGADLAFDTLELYRGGLTGWPQNIETQVDFLRGEVRPGRNTFRLRRNIETHQWFWTFDARAITFLAASISGSDTTIVLRGLQYNQQQNSLIYLERECIKMGTLASDTGTQATYINCERGQLETTALPHNADTGDYEVFDTPSAETLLGRMVSLYYLPAGATDYSDEQLMFAGPLGEVDAPNSSTFRLQCGTLLDLVRRGRISRDHWESIAGSTPLMSKNPPLTWSPGIVSGEGLFVVNDEYVVRGFWRTLGDRWSVDLLEAVTGSPPIPQYRVADLGGLRVREVDTTLAEQPARNDLDPSSGSLWQQPDIAVLQLLTTTENDGVGGANGPYDTGVNARACSVPARYVDAAAITAWGAQYGTVLVDNLILGAEGDEDPLERIQQILRVYGALLIPRAGRLTVVQLRSISPFGNDPQITQDQVVPAGDDPSFEQSRNLVHAVDRVEVRYGGFPGIDPSTVTAFNQFRRRRLPRGVADNVEIDASHIRRENEAAILGSGLAVRFHMPPPTAQLPVNRSADADVGDVVRVTHPLMLGNGTMGIDEGRWLVTGRRESWQGPQTLDDGNSGSYTIFLRMLYVGALATNAGLIGPTATVVSWDAGTRTLTVSDNDYTDPGGSLPADGMGFFVDDAIDIADQYWTPKHEDILIESKPAVNVWVLDSAPSPAPVAGDIITITSFTLANSTQYWSWIADDEGNIEGNPANAYQYT
jgi:hypothetical protein